MKSKKINLIVLLFVLSLVLYFTLKDNFKEVVYELSKVNILIFFIAILTFIVSLVFKSISLHIFIKEHQSKYSFKNIFKLTLIGQFLNGITPFQSGGQPFQIYLLKKEGLRISDSTNSMIKDFISFQIALILISLVSIFVNTWLNIIPAKPHLTWIIVLGFLINVMVLLFLILITTAKKFLLKILNKFFNLKLIKRIKIDKKRIIDGLENFYDGKLNLKKDKKNFILAIIVNLINLTFLYAVPFVIFRSIGFYKITLLSSIITTSLVVLIGNFIPIPGATGGIEYGFISFFRVFNIPFSILTGAMLLWRFVTYFLGMLIGFVTLALKEGVDKKCV